MLYNNYELNVLVKGRPITEYAHNGQNFIEGRDGSNFELEFKNKTLSRVEVIFSVDGLSIIDGKEAGPNSSGYVVNGNDTIRIPGWKLTDAEAASFIFSGKKTSYSTQMTGSSRNNGVIGVMVFSEKPKPLSNQFLRSSINAAPYGGTPWYGNEAGLTWSDSMITSQSMNAPQAVASLNSISTSNASNTRRITKSPIETVPEMQTLGTGFGKSTDFATTTISFERGDLSAMIVMYYDDARGLRSRGIELIKPSKARLSDQPQAFPGMNCQPPPGWKG